MLAQAGYFCALCGHYGAGDVDHILPLARGGELLEMTNLRASHGALSKCWECDPHRGKACNQARAGRAAPPFPTSREW